MSTHTQIWPSTFRVMPSPWDVRYGIPASWGHEYKARLLERYKREVVAVQGALDSLVQGAVEDDATELLSAGRQKAICVAVEVLLGWRGELSRRIALLDSREQGVTLSEMHGLDKAITS